MINLSRRDFVVSTGLAAALGLNSRLVVSPAFAQKTADPAKPFVTYKVGSAEVTAIYDGIWEKPHDPAFISNASVDDVKAAMVKAGLPPDFVSIPFTVVIVKSGGKTIMCDSGTGGQVQPTAGKLAANMKAAGIDAGKIDTILISHCHPDHIFGLMEKDTNKPVYPNAEIVISDVEYKFWTDPAVIDRLPEARKGLARRIQAVFPTWKNIRQVSGEPEVAPGIKLRQRARPHARPSRLPAGIRFEPVDDLERHRVSAGAGRCASGVARPVRSGWCHRGGVAPRTARPRHRRQDDDLRLPLPVPGRGDDPERRHGLCAHRHEVLTRQIGGLVSPLVPAQAGTQRRHRSGSILRCLDSRLRGNERREVRHTRRPSVKNMEISDENVQTLPPARTVCLTAALPVTARARSTTSPRTMRPT